MPLSRCVVARQAKMSGIKAKFYDLLNEIPIFEGVILLILTIITGMTSLLLIGSVTSLLPSLPERVIIES
jgi:hypothetical protein